MYILRFYRAVEREKISMIQIPMLNWVIVITNAEKGVRR